MTVRLGKEALGFGAWDRDAISDDLLENLTIKWGESREVSLECFNHIIVRWTDFDSNPTKHI